MVAFQKKKNNHDSLTLRWSKYINNNYQSKDKSKLNYIYAEYADNQQWTTVGCKSPALGLKASVKKKSMGKKKISRAHLAISDPITNIPCSE